MATLIVKCSKNMDIIQLNVTEMWISRENAHSSQLIPLMRGICHDMTAFGDCD